MSLLEPIARSNHTAYTHWLMQTKKKTPTTKLKPKPTKKKRCKRKNIHIVICRAIIVYSVLIVIGFSVATVTDARARLHLNAIGKFDEPNHSFIQSIAAHLALDVCCAYICNKQMKKRLLYVRFLPPRLKTVASTQFG